jgi:hypothetical protein
VRLTADRPNGSFLHELYFQAEKIVSSGFCGLLIALALKDLTSCPDPGLTVADP